MFSYKSILPRNLNYSIRMSDGQVMTKTQSWGRREKTGQHLPESKPTSKLVMNGPKISHKKVQHTFSSSPEPKPTQIPTFKTRSWIVRKIVSSVLWSGLTHTAIYGPQMKRNSSRRNPYLLEREAPNPSVLGTYS